MALVQYLIVHDFKLRSFAEGKGTVTAATSFMVKSLPAVLPIGVSLDLTYQLWADQANADKLDLTSISAGGFYARPLNSPFSETEIVAYASMTKGASPNVHQIGFVLPADTLSELWTKYGTTRLILRLNDAASPLRQIELYHELRLISHGDAGESSLLTSENYPITTETVTTDITLTAYPGRRVILVDTTAGDVAVTLFSAATYPYCRLEILHAGGGNRLTVIPDGIETINTVAGSAWTETLGGGFDLVPDGAGNWLNFNPIDSIEA